MGTLGSRSLIFPDGQGEKDIGRQVRGGSPLGSWGPEVLFSSTGRGERASDGEVRGKNPRRSWVPESAFPLTGRGKRQSRALPESLEILPAPLSSRAQILVERPGTAWHGLGRPGTAWHGLARFLFLRPPPKLLASLVEASCSSHTPHQRVGGYSYYIAEYILGVHSLHPRGVLRNY